MKTEPSAEAFDVTIRLVQAKAVSDARPASRATVTSKVKIVLFIAGRITRPPAGDNHRVKVASSGSDQTTGVVSRCGYRRGGCSTFGWGFRIPTQNSVSGGLPARDIRCWRPSPMSSGHAPNVRYRRSGRVDRVYHLGPPTWCWKRQAADRGARDMAPNSGTQIGQMSARVLFDTAAHPGNICYVSEISYFLDFRRPLDGLDGKNRQRWDR